MTHEDAPKYSAKHPAGTPRDPAVADALGDKAVDGTITCADAFDVAADLKVSPSAIGKTADLLEYRITRCQLGLFGFSPHKKIVEPAKEASAEVREQLEPFRRRRDHKLRGVLEDRGHHGHGTDGGRRRLRAS